MNGEIISRDQNQYHIGAAVTNDAAKDITMLRIDPVTGELVINITVDSAANGTGSTVARRDGNQYTVAMGYDETNDRLVEIATDENGNRS